MDLFSLYHAAGYDLKSCANCHAIALAAGKFETDPMMSFDAVVFQDHRTSHQVLDYHIHIPIIEQIADSKAASDAWLQQCCSRLIAGITKRAICLIQVKKFRLSIAGSGGESVHLGIDMSIDS